VLWREFRTAILLGGLLAAVALVRALTWPTSLPIALVVSITIFAIVVWADCVGSLLPLLAARLRIDPALVSGPLMSTLVDATGLLIYFCIAAALLRI
jgi:magnesium transporter